MSTGSAQETPSNSKDKPGIWPDDTYPMFPVEEKDNGDPSASDPWSGLYHDSWKGILQQSARWKDEIQSLLTFTGLFSAVVGGFLAATYKDLSLDPDPGDTSNLLLAQIALRLDASIGITNATSIPPLSLSPSFSPPRSLVRVHISWFLSLTLALSTAIVGILCLQWIREYERHSPHVREGRRGFAILAMRMESFKRWHVPAIIAYLPQLLQVSLVLFFVGMIDFLLPLGKSIAIPTIVVISITFLFLLYTTFIPMAQMAFHCFVQRPFSKWYPSAYRSPQAWRVITTAVWALCAGLVVASLPIILVASAFDQVRNLMLCHASNEEPRETTLDAVMNLWRTVMQAVVSESSGIAGREWGAWSFDFVLDALGRRWDIQGATDQLEGLYAVRGLLDFTIVSGNQVGTHAIFRYVDTLPKPVFDSDGIVPAVTSAMVSTIQDPNLVLSSLLLCSWSDPSLELRATERKLLLIVTLHNDMQGGRDPNLALHELELYIRLLAGIYAGPVWMKRNPGIEGLSQRRGYIPQELRAKGVREKLWKIKNADVCIEQLVLIWASFAKRLLDSERDEPIEEGQHHTGNDIWYLTSIVIPTLSIFIRSSVEGGSTTAPLSDGILRSLQVLGEINDLASSLSPTSPIVVRKTIGYYLEACCGWDVRVSTPGLSDSPPLWEAPLGSTARPLDAKAKEIVGDYVTSLLVLAQKLRQKVPPEDPQGEHPYGVFFESIWSAAIPPPPAMSALVPDDTTRNQPSDPPVIQSALLSSPQLLSPPDATISRPGVQDGEVLAVYKVSPPPSPEVNLSTRPDSSTSYLPPTIIPNDSNSFSFPYPTPSPIPLNPYDAVIDISATDPPIHDQGNELLVVDNVSPSTLDANLSIDPVFSTPDPPPTIVPNESNSLALLYPTPSSISPSPYDAVIEVLHPGSPTSHSSPTSTSASGPMPAPASDDDDASNATRRSRITVVEPSAVEVPSELGTDPASRPTLSEG